jgi:hypothetical protein
MHRKCKLSIFWNKKNLKYGTYTMSCWLFLFLLVCWYISSFEIQITSGTKQNSLFYYKYGPRISISTITLPNSYITQVSFQTALYCWVCQMLHETSSILSTVKTGLQIYCDTSYSRGGVNQMWILKNSKDLLDYIRSSSLSSCNSIKTVNLSSQLFLTLRWRTN